MNNHGVSKLTVTDVQNWSVSKQRSDGRWLPDRPIGSSNIFRRIKYSWLVFTGKADVLIWE